MEHGFDPLLPFHITPFLAVPWHIALLLDVLWHGGNEALQPTTGETKVSFHRCEMLSVGNYPRAELPGYEWSLNVCLGSWVGSGAQMTHGCDS